MSTARQLKKLLFPIFLLTAVKIFDRYYRVQNEQTKVVSGFGIGLFLSAEIIKLHGGEIGLDSEYGNGSTFYFRLPLAGKNAE